MEAVNSKLITKWKTRLSFIRKGVEDGFSLNDWEAGFINSIDYQLRINNSMLTCQQGLALSRIYQKVVSYEG